MAPSYVSQQAAVEAMQFRGATIVDLGVNFSVYSENATRIDLLIWQNPDSRSSHQEYQLRPDGQRVERLRRRHRPRDLLQLRGLGTELGRRSELDPWDALRLPDGRRQAGNRFNPNKLLFDPYCQAINTNFNWNIGSRRDGT